MIDKRLAARQRSFLRGYVHFGNSPSAVDCTVRDISDTGARLKFSGAPLATDTLTLNIPVKGQTLNAQVKWRCADEIGVVFVAAPAIGIAHANDAELSSRVEKLETEITALNQLIKQLHKNTSTITDVA